MKQKILLCTISMIVLAMPKVAGAYDFSAVVPSGQTLYYSVVDGNAQVTCPNLNDSYIGYTEPTGNLTIPSGVSYEGNTYSVTCIGNFAFRGCSALTSVTIPSSVTSIGACAFYGCSGLTTPNTYR